MEKIALMGLGKMGSALATRILEGKLPLVVYNRTAGKAEELIKLGAIEAISLVEAVSDADIVVTCLLDDAAVLKVATEFLPCMKKNAVHVGTSTIQPATSNELELLHAKHGSYYIAANVLGVPKVARAGKLTTLVAGSAGSISRCRFLLETFSEHILEIGDKPANANVMKISVNYILMTALELISELYVYSEKNNVDISYIQGMLHVIFAHPAVKLYIDKIKARDFDNVNFDMRGGAKDVAIFQKAFTSSCVAPELANVVSRRFSAAIAEGMENKDWSAIYEVIRTEAGLK